MESRQEFLNNMLISPKCAPFWDIKGTLSVVLAEPDSFNTLGVAAGLQIVGHETYLRSRADVDFAGLCDPEIEPESRTLFTNREVAQADILGIGVPNPCIMPDFFTLLERSGIPVLREKRILYDHPFVVVGGLGACNPAPIERFVDAFVIGEGSIAMSQLVEVYANARDRRAARAELDMELSAIPGVYVPTAFKFEYHQGSLVQIRPDVMVDFQKLENVKGTRRASLFMRPHRGLILADYSCKFKCSFCQMSHARGRYTFQGSEAVKEYLNEYDAMGVTTATLSAATATNIPLQELQDIFNWAKRNLKTTELVIRSVRADELPTIINLLHQDRFHLAPETASDYLRINILNKGFTNDQIMDALRAVAGTGASHLRLYHIVGIPGETDRDRERYSQLVAAASQCVSSIQVNMYPLLPPPGTPLEDRGAIGLDTFKKYCQEFEDWTKPILKSGTSLTVKSLDPLLHLLQGIAHTGDRNAGEVLYDGYLRGNSLSDYMDACKNASIDFRVQFRPGYTGIKPWAMIRLGNERFVEARKKVISKAIIGRDSHK